MNEKIVENQKAITAALQEAVLSAITSGKPYAHYLDSVRFSVEITEVLICNRESLSTVMNRCEGRF